MQYLGIYELIQNSGYAYGRLANVELQLSELRKDIGALRAEQARKRVVPQTEHETAEQLARKHGLPERYAALVDFERLP